MGSGGSRGTSRTGPTQFRRVVHELVLGGCELLGFAYGDVTVPAGTQRLVVVLTWDEPAASAGASRAVTL